MKHHNAPYTWYEVTQLTGRWSFCSSINARNGGLSFDAMIQLLLTLVKYALVGFLALCSFAMLVVALV
ncbi:MAG: hypothetical protein AAGB22_10445, partial [Bacteroidota bacterium]